MIYIGIDIAKFTHFASAVNSDGEVLIKPFSFENSRKGFDLFMSKIKDFDIDNCLIGLESTGHYGDNLIYFLFNANYKIGLINAIQTNSLRNTNIRKTKNDKIDTFLIAKCISLGNYSLIKQKDIEIIKLRTLCRFREDVIFHQTKLKVQYVNCLDQIFPELYHFFKGNLHLKTCYELLRKYSSPEVIAHTRIDALTNILHKSSKGHYSYDEAVVLKDLAKHSIGVNNPAISIQIIYLIEQLDLLKEQINGIDNNIKEIMDKLNTPILTIPGVGYILGAMIISEIGDIKRFSNPHKLIAYAGIDPSIRQSGNFNASTTRISKRGSSHLRYAIHRASFLLVYNNDVIYKYYTTKRSQGKSHTNALGHVAGKLTRIIFKLLTENIVFNLS